MTKGFHDSWKLLSSNVSLDNLCNSGLRIKLVNPDPDLFVKETNLLTDRLLCNGDTRLFDGPEVIDSLRQK